MHEAGSYHDKEMQFLYDIQQASVARTKMPFSLIFVQLVRAFQLEEGVKNCYEELYSFVSKYSRNTDRVYRHHSQRFVIIISLFSGNDEAQAYFKRLVSYIPQHFVQQPIGIVGTTNEVTNAAFSLQQIIDYNIQFFSELEEETINIAHTIREFSAVVTETIKVSILENNHVALSILKNSIQNLSMPKFDLQLQTFSDGLQFVESDWHLSGHTHIVIANDTLPFKNGLEIVTYLRSLPNDAKYIILLISKRSTEEAIIYAYNSGVDAYFTRPFNIRLFEARMKSILKRLR